MSQAKLLSSGAECRPSSPEDSPASLTALQESVSRLVTSVTSGGNSPESFAKLSHDGSWVKTSQGSVQVSLDGSLEEFCETWPKWGILSGGVVGRLPTPERRTTASGCSLWPTPRTSDTQSGRIVEVNENGSLCRVNRDRTQTYGANLSDAVVMWPTPLAQDARRSGHGATDRDKTGLLARAVVLWPTPLSNDSKNATHPPAAGKRDSVPGALIREGISGSLNPTWVEWLMGFPDGWTDLSVSGTRSFRSRRSRSSRRSRRSRWGR